MGARHGKGGGTRPMAAAHLAGRRRERLTRDIYLGGAKAVGGV